MTGAEEDIVYVVARVLVYACREGDAAHDGGARPAGVVRS